MEHFLLGFIGGTIALVAAYLQLASADLSRHSVADYIASDLQFWGWWRTIGIPFLVGLAYIGAAVYGLVATLSNKHSLILLMRCCQ